MPHRIDHSADLRRVGLNHRPVRPPQPERLNRALVGFEGIDLTDDLRYLDLFGHFQLTDSPATGAGVRKSSSTVIPRRCAMVRASMSVSRALIVALTTLCGFDEPIDFVRTSFTPADSRTALTPPPAIRPVPGEAGFRRTFEAPYFAVIGCGIVPFTTRTVTIFFFASSIPLEIAS